MTEEQRELVTMKDGRVMTMRGGQLAPVDAEVTLPDGTRVQADGTVLLTDGTTRMMVEGETMYMDGRVMDMTNMPDTGSPGGADNTESHDPT